MLFLIITVSISIVKCKHGCLPSFLNHHSNIPYRTLTNGFLSLKLMVTYSKRRRENAKDEERLARSLELDIVRDGVREEESNLEENLRK